MLPLHRNDNSSIVASVFFAARMCLATRSLAVDIHVTVYSETRHAAQHTTGENTAHQLKHACASRGLIY
jgi:hypothetical protein